MASVSTLYRSNGAYLHEIHTHFYLQETVALMIVARRICCAQTPSPATTLWDNYYPINIAYLVEPSISAASQPPFLSFLHVELRLAESQQTIERGNPR
jgi:hypothetical protein